MRKLGTGNMGRVGALAFAIVSSIAGCGDNGVTPPPDAPNIDAPPPKPAVLSMMPSQNDFGSVLITQTSGTASFTVTNTGEATSGAITPVVTGTNAGDFTATNGCTTLAGGGTCVITVVFKPTTAGTKSGSLVVSGSPGGTVMAALLGTGGIPGTIQLNNPTSLSFGNVTVGATGTQQTFTFQNTGTVATSAITTTTAGSDPGEFTKVSDNCNGQTLAANATCTVVVNFRPTSAGPKTASFVVSATTGGSANGAVSGTGIAAANLTLNPTLQDFGTVAIGQSSSNVTFNVQNIGGVATSAITNTGTGDYTIVNSNCAGVQLAPLATCNVIVRFTPTVVGTRAGTLDVSAVTGGSRQSSLTGVGVTAGTIQFAVGDNPFVYPGTTVGQTSTSHLFTITNTGGTPTGALGTALGGTDPSQFTIVGGSNGCQGVVLAPGGTCTIAAVFNPTTGGNKSATLTVTGTPGGSAVAAISGLGIAPAQFSFDIASRDYGSVVTTTMGSIQRFRLTNVGGQNSAIPAAALNGAQASEFTITSNTCTAALTPSPAAGSFCDIFVQFLPVTVGAKVATLDVLGNPGGPVQAGLSGNGVAQAALAVNPSILTFPLTLIGNTSASQTFTVTNQGSVTTGVLSVTIVGAAATDYAITANNCEDGGGPGTDVLIAGGFCDITVVFSPTLRDARNASVQISGTPGGTVTTALNGTSLPRLEILTPTPVTIPNTFNFGSSIVDPNPFLNPAGRTTLVTVRNNTAAAQTVTNTETDSTASFFPTAGCTGTNVGAGASCTFNVQFAPHQVGPVAGSYALSIAGTATGCPAALATCNNATQQVNGVGTNDTISISDGDVTPTAHNFGNQGTGTSSQVRTFTVTNNGTSSTGVIAVDLAGTGFQITSNNCSGAVLTTFGPGPAPAVGATCTIGVVFTPATTGAATGMITVRTSLTTPTTLGGMVMATVTGTGVAPAPLANPMMLDWGTLFAGEAVVNANGPANQTATNKVFVVTNPNDVTTTVSVTVNNGASLYSRRVGGPNDCGATLGAGLSCNVEIQFIPLLPTGTRPAANVVVTLGTGNLSATVTLAAAVKSTISYVAAPTNFSNVVAGASATQTIMVHNDTANQTLTGFVMNAGGMPFFIFNNTCNAGNLGPNGTCMFDLQYSPTAAGNNPTAMVVTANNLAAVATGEISAAVTANAITPANITVSPTVFSFGSEVVGQMGASQVFTFTNIGQQASSTFSPALAGAQAANWTVTATTCGAAIAGGASCTATVRFNPGAAGALAANLTGTATTGGTASAALTGTGVALNGLRVTPTAFTFANTTAGGNSANTTFTVQNTNGGASAAVNISVSNADFSLVAGGTCPVGAGTIAAGASCTQLVRFNPASSVAPAKTATLNIDATTFASLYGTALTVANVTSNLGGTFTGPGISINDNPNPSAPFPSTINVTGVNGNVSNLRVRLNGFSHTFPDDVDIMLVSPDNTRRLVVMSDVGGATDAVGANITIDDAAAAGFSGVVTSGTFRPTNNGTGDLFPGAGGGGQDSAPAGTATLTSVFAGTAANGTWSLYVRDDAGADSGTIGSWSIEINGSGFPDTAIGGAAGTRTFVLTNNGQTASPTITGVVGGADASHFFIMDNCNGVALAPNASCTLLVDFRPTTTGAKVATVTYSGGFSTVATFTGLAVNPALLTITPSGVQNDGSRPIGELDTLSTTFTVGNTAGTAITSGISFSFSNPANYVFAAGGSCVLDGSQTLLPGASCTVNVRFNPTQLGVQATNVVVSALTGGTVNGLMTGTGTQALVLTAQAPAFVNAVAGNAGSDQTLTFKNEADSSTTLIQTVLANTAGTDFSILSDNCGGSSLAANQSCTIVVHFTPSGTPGARTGSVTISGVVTGTATSASANLTATVN